MNIKEIEKMLEECDEPSDLAFDGSDGWEAGTLFKLIEQGEEEVDGKWCFTSTILQEIATEEYYEITTSRTNSGYWGDGERGDTDIRQVRPVVRVVEITEWRSV